MKTYSKASLIISAALMIITGIIVLCNPAATIVSVSWIIGVMTIASGISALIFYFSAARGGFGAGTVLFAGISDIVLGIVFLNHGLFIAQLLAFIAGLWLTVFGVERFIRAFDLKRLLYDRWWLTLIIGILCTVSGVLTMLSPITGAIIVSFVIGFGFILHGAALLALLHAIKKADKDNNIFYE